MTAYLGHDQGINTHSNHNPHVQACTSTQSIAQYGVATFSPSPPPSGTPILFCDVWLMFLQFDLWFIRPVLLHSPWCLQFWLTMLQLPSWYPHRSVHIGKLEIYRASDSSLGHAMVLFCDHMCTRTSCESAMGHPNKGRVRIFSTYYLKCVSNPSVLGLTQQFSLQRWVGLPLMYVRPLIAN